MALDRGEYTRYRGIQQERIENAAQKLFIKYGIHAVSIDAIAEEAQITRKTFYQYFQNKEEIALTIFEKFRAARRKSYEDKNITMGTGAERLEAAVYDMCGMLLEHQEYMRFMVEFDTMFSRNRDLGNIFEVYDHEIKNFVNVINDGIADGSIRSDVDANMLGGAIINMIAGMNSRFALLGDCFRQESDSLPEDYLHLVCKYLLDGIRA